MSILDRINKLTDRLSLRSQKPAATMEIDGVKVDVYGDGDRFVMTNDKGDQVEALADFNKEEIYSGFYPTPTGRFNHKLTVELKQSEVSFGTESVVLFDDETRSEAFARLRGLKRVVTTEDKLFEIIAKAGAQFHEAADRPVIEKRKAKKNADELKAIQDKNMLNAFFDKGR